MSRCYCALWLQTHFPDEAVSRDMGYEVIEFNASDTRSKNALKVYCSTRDWVLRHYSVVWKMENIPMRDLHLSLMNVLLCARGGGELYESKLDGDVCTNMLTDALLRVNASHGAVNVDCSQEQGRWHPMSESVMTVLADGSSSGEGELKIHGVAAEGRAIDIYAEHHNTLHLKSLAGHIIINGTSQVNAGVLKRVNDTVALNVTIESGSGTMSFIGYSDGGFSTRGPGVRINTDGLWSAAAHDRSSIYVSGRAECGAAVISSNRGVERWYTQDGDIQIVGWKRICTPDGIGFIGEESGSTIVQAGGSGALTMTTTTHDSHSYGVHLLCDGTKSVFRSEAGAFM